MIGAGRLGLALGEALSRRRYRINIAITRTSAGAQRAKLLGTLTVPTRGRPLDKLRPEHRELIQQSDQLIIATPDDSIAETANQLARLLQLSKAEKHGQRTASIAIHTSGALTSKALSPLLPLGISIASMHPLISISGGLASPSFSDIYFSLEGDGPAVRAGKQLVRDLGGNSFVIKPDDKPLYHAAALMASPNLTALIDIAVEILNHCGIASSRARKILLPLVQSTIDNLKLHAPRRALTGTFKRGDVATVRKHLQAIASERLTDAMRTYVALGRRSLNLSEVPPKKKAEIESLLRASIRRPSRR